MAKMALKIKVNDFHFQYQPRVSQDSCLVQIWWFQLKSVTSYCVDKVKFTDGQTDRRTDRMTDGQTDVSIWWRHHEESSQLPLPDMLEKLTELLELFRGAFHDSSTALTQSRLTPKNGSNTYTILYLVRLGIASSIDSVTFCRFWAGHDTQTD